MLNCDLVDNFNIFSPSMSDTEPRDLVAEGMHRVEYTHFHITGYLPLDAAPFSRAAHAILCLCLPLCKVKKTDMTNLIRSEKPFREP